MCYFKLLKVIKFFRKKGYNFFLLLFFISILPFFGRLFQENKYQKPANELFVPELITLNSLDKLSNYADKLYAQKNIKGFDTAEYVHVFSRVVREKFYHGLSQYTISENWIAYLCGKLFWSHLSVIVVPDDILKHHEGLCSQQTVVFMELLRQKKINVRWVGLGHEEGPGHFLCEAHYLGSWRLHDVTIEPQWKNVVGNHKSMDYYFHHKDSLYNVYKNRMNRAVFDKITEKVTYGKNNAFPGKNMFIFQKATSLLTYIIPLVLLLISIRLYKTTRKEEDVSVITISQKQPEADCLAL